MAVPLWLADGIAKLAQKAPGAPRLAPGAFTELPAITEEVSIPTRHGAITAFQYSPPGGPIGKGVYVNFHGGGFVLRAAGSCYATRSKTMPSADISRPTPT